MSDAETYLRELRRALPFGCRRRFVAEMREHFESAADAGEAEQLTIERLGPAPALAEQLLADLRSGALGRGARLTAALTTTRLVACACLVAIAAVAGAVFAGKHSSPAPAAPQHTAIATVTLDPKTGQVRAAVTALQAVVLRHQTGLWITRGTTTPRLRIYLTPAQPKR